MVDWEKSLGFGLGLLVFVVIAFSINTIWSSVPETVFVTIDKTVEEAAKAEGVTMSQGSVNVLRVHSAENETDFLDQVKENNIKNIFYSFEAEKSISKKYWALLPNGLIEYKESYYPPFATFYSPKEYDEDRAVFQKDREEYGYFLLLIAIIVICVVYTLTYFAISTLKIAYRVLAFICGKLSHERRKIRKKRAFALLLILIAMLLAYSCTGEQIILFGAVLIIVAVILLTGLGLNLKNVLSSYDPSF